MRLGAFFELRHLRRILCEDFVDDFVERSFVGDLHEPLLLNNLLRCIPTAVDLGEDLARDFQTDRPLINQLKKADKPFG